MARSRKRPGAVTGAGRHSKGFVQPQSRKAKAETDEEKANGAAEEVLGVRGRVQSRSLWPPSSSSVRSTTSGGDTQVGWGETVVQSCAWFVLFSCSTDASFQEDRLFITPPLGCAHLRPAENGARDRQSVSERHKKWRRLQNCLLHSCRPLRMLLLFLFFSLAHCAAF